jgi:hypothetical protein
MRIVVVGLIMVVGALTYSGCVKVGYVGETLPPTERVDVYYSPDDITVPYRIIGRAELTAKALRTYEGMREKAIEEGKKRGADAVVLGSPSKRSSGSSTGSFWGDTWHAQEYKEKVLPAVFIVYE